MCPLFSVHKLYFAVDFSSNKEHKSKLSAFWHPNVPYAAITIDWRLRRLPRLSIIKRRCFATRREGVRALCQGRIGVWPLSSTSLGLCCWSQVTTQQGLKYNFQGGGTVQLSGPPVCSGAPVHFLGPRFNSGLSNFQRLTECIKHDVILLFF